MPGLERAAKALLKGAPIHLNVDQSHVLVAQFVETAGVRRWDIRAISVMPDHFHLVVGAADEVEPAKILGDFKSWATRALTTRFGAPASQTWWTERGSKKSLPNERAIEDAIQYVVARQPNPLLVWRK